MKASVRACAGNDGDGGGGRDAGLHVRAEVLSGLEGLSAPERNEPQQLPTSATNFSQHPLPGPLGAKSGEEEEEEEEKKKEEA